MARAVIAGLCLLAAPTFAAQGPGAAAGAASGAEQAVAIAFILALPLTLSAIGLMRRF